MDLPLSSMLSNRGSLDLYPEVTGRGYLNVTLRGDRLRFRAGSYIGSIPLNDRYVLQVSPRVDVNRLSRLLAISGGLPVEIERLARPYSRDSERIDTIIDVLARAFIAATDRIVKTGLKRQYMRLESNTSFPRGRLNMHGTVKNRAGGIRHMLQTVRYEPSVDNPANRILKYALHFLSNQYALVEGRSGHRRIVGELNRLSRALGRIELVKPRSSHDDSWALAWNGLHALPDYYDLGVKLALLILRSEGIDIDVGDDAGDIQLPSLLIKMDDVFEDYVRGVLLRGVSDLVVQDGNKEPPDGAARGVFEGRDQPKATPDIVVKDAGSGACVVIEVKYKTSFRRADLNQAIAYGAIYGAQRVVLVTLGEESSSTFLGKVGRMQIHRQAMHLGGDLETEEQRLCNLVRRLIQVGTPSSAQSERVS